MSKKGMGKFVAGAALGAGLGVLFAPKKGKDTREDLKHKIEEIINQVKSLDKDEVKAEFDKKIKEIKKELEDLDKEKVLKIAKKKGEEINRQAVFTGTYEIQIGASSAEILRTAEINVNGEDYIGLEVKKTVPASASWEYTGVEFLTDKNLNEYALLSDGYSSIYFENCILNNENNVEVVVSNPSAKTKVYIINSDKNEILSEIDIPTTGSLSEFRAFSSAFTPVIGKCKLKIRADGILSFKSFRLF